MLRGSLVRIKGLSKFLFVHNVLTPTGKVVKHKLAEMAAHSY